MIHLVVPPARSGGVYDFSCKLQETVEHSAVRLVQLSKDNAPGWDVGSHDAVVLQLSSYGFQKRGVPVWLLREVEKRRNDIKTLGVFFHELYAFGPPWSSAFWLSPVQRHIARRFAVLSDFWMTSREGSAQWLRKHARDKPHAVLPVFSTIGEPERPSEDRLPRVVVFGSPGLRQATYLAAGERLFSWAKRDSLQIHDIGAPLADTQLSDGLRASGVIFHGRLADHDVRRVMQEAAFGLLAYPIDYVAKSSVFAAYCAHGLCPVLISSSYGPADGLVSGVQYLAGIPRGFGAPAARAIAQSALEWYRPHCLQGHLRALATLVKEASEGGGD